MREILEAAGYQSNVQRNITEPNGTIGAVAVDEPAIVAKQMYLSGGFNEPFMSKILGHIGVTKENQAVFKKAVADAQRNDGTKDFDVNLFFGQTSALPKADLWAYTIAATQRFFQNEVVVRQQQPTDYTKDHKDQIIEFSRQMGMLETQQLEGEPVHVGVCIGATSKGANDYLKRQKAILDGRHNQSEPYQLFVLLGGRKLGAVDDLQAPTGDFQYDGSNGSYLDYLAAYSNKDKSQLTEADMMRERHQAIIGRAAQTVFIEAPDAEKFMGKVAEQLSPREEIIPKTLAITTYDVFARTYQTMMEMALNDHKVIGMVVQCDAPKSAFTDKPQVQIRELSKTLNTQYEAVAIKLEFEPHPKANLSGNVIKALETEVTREWNNAAIAIQRIARGGAARTHVEKLQEQAKDSVAQGIRK